MDNSKLMASWNKPLKNSCLKLACFALPIDFTTSQNLPLLMVQLPELACLCYLDFSFGFATIFNQSFFAGELLRI
jgi:hypothetical protein